jgi:hypothetical protein
MVWKLISRRPSSAGKVLAGRPELKLRNRRRSPEWELSTRMNDAGILALIQNMFAAPATQTNRFTQRSFSRTSALILDAVICGACATNSRLLDVGYGFGWDAVAISLLGNNEIIANDVLPR